jgi:hypothetical protein
MWSFIPDLLNGSISLILNKIHAMAIFGHHRQAKDICDGMPLDIIFE